MIRLILIVILACAAGGCLDGGNGAWPLEAQSLTLHPENPVTPKSDAIVVATYNIRGFSRPQQLQRDITEVNADIWLFQEAALDRKQFISDIEAVLPPGKWHIAIVRVNPIFDRDESQIIASRFPIGEVEVWPLAPGSVRRRCALAARIDIAGRQILVINTDHEPNFSGPNIWHERHRQALISRLKSLAEPQVIVGGDFNTCGSLWRMRDTRGDAQDTHDQFHTLSFNPAAKLPYDTLTFGPIALCLDHLFVRGLKVEQGGIASSARGSDHRPVWCRIRLDAP